MTHQAYEMAAAFARRPLDRARRLTAINTTGEMRAYLAETGSMYAAHEDDGMVRAAFLGAVQFALEDLANSYEQVREQQAVAHAKLCDLEAQLNANQFAGHHG